VAVTRLLSPEELQTFARQAVLALVRERDACVFPEVAAVLNRDGDWIRRTLPDFPYPRFDLHVVREARRVLLELGELEELSATLSGREIKALVYGPDYRERGRRTVVMDAAAAKRRLYNTYLSWAMNPAMCGRVAERVVIASMRAAGGLYGIPGSPGNVRVIEGQALEDGKTLDATAHAVVDPEQPTRGEHAAFIPIGVEVKNVRQTLYPTSREVWDLLTKLAPFPDVVPVLVARQVHPTLFKMFADLGAAAHYTQVQYFSSEIPQERFREITSALSFRDTRQMDDPDRPQPAIVGFFSKNLRAPRVEEPADDRPLLIRARERWAQASTIVANYADLAAEVEVDEHRDDLFADFRKEIEAAGLRTVAGW
jgi:hypothetical protein